VPDARRPPTRGGGGEVLARILHVSDVHCAVGRLEELLASESYDVVAVTGDLECVEAARLLRRTRGPVVAVTGNVDSLLVAEELGSAGLLLDGETRRAAGLLFAGVGGRDPLGDAERLLAGSPGGVDVVLTHYPPRGVLDRTYSGCSGGLEAVRRLVERLRPLAVLCGHIHEARGVASLAGSLVVNPGPLLHGYYAVVEVAPGERPRAVLGSLH